jgi:hypothetical protein
VSASHLPGGSQSAEGVNMFSNLRRRVSTVALLALAALMVLPGLAFAQSTGETAVNSAVSSAVTSATSVVTTGIPLILGVAAIWVALRFGKSLLSKI